MTRRPAEFEEPGPAEPARDGRGLFLGLALLVSGLGAALAIYALPLFILVYGGLMPGIVALVVDERIGRHLTVTVASFNAAGLMIVLGPLFSSAVTETAAYQIVSNPTSWLLIYGAAAAGWVLSWILPIFVSQGLELVDRQRYRATELAREAILKQWPSLANPSAHNASLAEPLFEPPDEIGRPRRQERATTA